MSKKDGAHLGDGLHLEKQDEHHLESGVHLWNKINTIN